MNRSKSHARTLRADTAERSGWATAKIFCRARHAVPPTKSFEMSVGFLSHDMNVDGRGVFQETADGVHVKEFLPAFDSGAAEDHLRHVFFADKFRGGVGHAASLQAHGRGPEAFGELQIRGE